MSSWSKDSFPPFDWPEGTYFYCPLTYSVSHYIHAFIQDLPVNACNSFFPVLPYCFPCPQKMPNTGVVIRSILFLQTLWFLHFCLRLTILPHSSMPSDPRHTVFLWCLYAPFDTADPPFTMVKYKLLSQHLSFWPIFLWGGGQILDSDRLSETQRCSWFHQDGVRYKGCSPELTSADRGTHQGKTISFVRLCSFFRTASQIQYFTVNKQRKQTYSSWFPRKFPSEYEGFSSLGVMTNLCWNCHQPA